MSYLIAASLDDRFLETLKDTVYGGQPRQASECLATIRGLLERGLTGDPDDYWANHTTFGGTRGKSSRQLIGVQRRREMLVNVVLPFLHAIARQERNMAAQELVQEMFRAHGPLPQNEVMRHMSMVLFNDLTSGPAMIRHARIQQGLQYIDEVACHRKDCTRCPLSVLFISDSPLPGPDELVSQPDVRVAKSST